MKPLFIVIVLVAFAHALQAHITPPRVLLQDMEAARLLLPAATEFAKADIKPTSSQREQIKKILQWTPEQKNYKSFIGRDAQGRYRGRVIFIGDITIHGLVQAAVSLDAEGKVGGAAVVAITDEAYGWVKPLVEQNFTAQFVGKGPTDAYIEGQRVAARRGSMQQFYGQVLAILLQRSAVIGHVAGNPA